MGQPIRGFESHPLRHYILNSFNIFIILLFLIFIVTNCVCSSFVEIVFGLLKIFFRLIFVITSPFITTNDSSDIFSIAFLIAPPVPNGVFSTENSILHLKFLKIVEAKDCTPEEYAIKNVNCGIYSFINKYIIKYVYDIKNNNSQNEYYLTDLIEIIKTGENIDVETYNLPSSKEIELTNVNDQKNLK